MLTRVFGWFVRLKIDLERLMSLVFFAMTDRGLRGVANPSALFLSQHEKKKVGWVLCAW